MNSQSIDVKCNEMKETVRELVRRNDGNGMSVSVENRLDAVLGFLGKAPVDQDINHSEIVD